MMRIVVFLALFGSAFSFSVVHQHAVRNTLKLEVKSKSVPFLEAPIHIDPSVSGYASFDPLGFTNQWLDKDWSEQIVPNIWPESSSNQRKGIKTIEWMQEAELKHGRTSMLAIVGWLAVDKGNRFPGSEKVTGSITTSLSAHDASVQNGSMGVLLLLCFILELAGGAAIFEQAKGSGRIPGDFSFDPLVLAKTPASRKSMMEKEVVHSRLAMLAFSGIVTVSAAFTEKTFPFI